MSPTSETIEANESGALGALSSSNLDSALRHEPTDKRVEILRLIGASGSISQAARDAGVSYKAAWQAIDTLTNLAGVALVDRAVGGTGGGGTKITTAGRQLLVAAGHLAASRLQVLKHLDFKGTNTVPVNTLVHIGVRTSMRNQLPCVVSKIKAQGQLVRVHLALAGGAELVSRITKASAELLELETGLGVLALCKATGVVVKAEQVRTGDAATQQLSGQASRISRGISGDEVSLHLDAGLQLVGFAPVGSGLKLRVRVTAQIDESAVVIALVG